MASWAIRRVIECLLIFVVIVILRNVITVRHITTLHVPRHNSQSIQVIADKSPNIKKPPLIPIPKGDTQNKLLTVLKYPFLNTTSAVLEPRYVCSDRGEVLLVALIHSSPDHFERRKIIRRTWTSTSLFPNIKRIFLFGTIKNHQLQKAIENEHRKHKDILQGEFADSYYNLTFNTMTGLRWLKQHCKNVKLVMKVDDDIVIDMFTFMSKVVSTFASSRRSVFCFYAKREIPRSKRHKWFIDQNQFKEKKYYPPYCEGKLVLMTYDIINEMYNYALQTPFFYMEDVFFYGFVMNEIKKLKITQLRWNRDFQLKSDVAKQCLRMQKENCSYYAAGAPSVNTMKDLWLLFGQRFIGTT